MFGARLTAHLHQYINTRRTCLAQANSHFFLFSFSRFDMIRSHTPFLSNSARLLNDDHCSWIHDSECIFSSFHEQERPEPQIPMHVSEK